MADYKPYGSYAVFMSEPETEAEKADLVLAGISEIIGSIKQAGARIDWTTAQLIVKEERNALMSPLDWYGDFDEEPIKWRMIVALKVKGEPYADISTDDPSPTDGLCDGLASPERTL